MPTKYKVTKDDERKVEAVVMAESARLGAERDMVTLLDAAVFQVDDDIQLVTIVYEARHVHSAYITRVENVTIDTRWGTWKLTESLEEMSQLFSGTVKDTVWVAPEQTDA